MKRKTIKLGEKRFKFYILDQREFDDPKSESPCSRCCYQESPTCEDYKSPVNPEEDFSDFCCTLGTDKSYTYIPFPGTLELYGEEKTYKDRREEIGF